MNLVDILVLLIILGFGLVGLKRGVFKELVTTLGFILVIILAYYLKRPVAELLSLHLPFFGKISSFNIMLYQGIAFLVIVLILEALLGVIIRVTGLFEKLLDLTIVLGLASKILGFIVGIIEGVAITFIVLFFLNQPVFKINSINESKVSTGILNNTPVLSNVANGMVNTIDDIYKITKDKAKLSDQEIDLEAIDSMLKNKVIDKDYVEKLIKNKKIDIPNIENILKNY